MTENQEKLKSAFMRYEQEFFRNMPYDAEARHSAHRYRRTLKRIRQYEGNSASCIGRRLVIILVAAICSIAMLSAAKQPLTDFIVRTYEKYIEFMIRGKDENAPLSLLTIYNNIGYLPKGYYREDVFKNGFSAQSIWRNRENDKLVLYQTLYSSTETMIGNENDYGTFYLSDVRIMETEKFGRKIFFWSYQGYTFELSGSNKITHDEYIKMIGNLIGAEK